MNATLPRELASVILVGTLGFLPARHMDIEMMTILVTFDAQYALQGSLHTRLDFEVGIRGTQISFQPLQVCQESSTT